MTTVATVASGLSKRYGRRQPWVLDHLDLRFEPGTLTVVVGANGCGKSTLLRVLAGVSRPTEGLITQRPRQVGYVPERLPARLQMTGREYLAHMSRLRSLDSTYAGCRSEESRCSVVVEPGPGRPDQVPLKGQQPKSGPGPGFPGSRGPPPPGRTLERSRRERFGRACARKWARPRGRGRRLSPRRTVLTLSPVRTATCCCPVGT